jgi:ribosomal protein S18 acetylase RimI-like enzyme
MDIVVRNAYYNDLSSIQQCNMKNLPIYYNIYDYYLFLFQSNQYKLIVATIDNNIVGYLLGEYQDKNFHILSIAVNPNYRRMSIGTKLIRYIIQNTNKESITLFVHVNNKSAISFYMKNGFTVIKLLDNYYNGQLNDTSQDAYIMKLNLVTSTH